MKRELVFASSLMAVAAVTGMVLMKKGTAQTPVPKPPHSNLRAISQDTTAPPGAVERGKKQEAVYQTGRGLMRQKKWAQASAKLEEAIAVDPKGAIPPLFEDLAKSLQAQGHSKEALASMRKAFFGGWSGLENHPEALVRYAELAEKAGEKNEAARAYAQAVKAGASVNSDMEGELGTASAHQTEKQLRALALVAAGQEGHRKSNEAGANLLFREALMVDPQCALAHLNVAQSLPEDSPDALVHYNAAASLSQSPTLRRFATLRATETAARIRQKQEKQVH